jgi:hypothetical protein
MQYDFNLAPNTGLQIDVAGKFFKYKSGTGLIRVRTSKGGFVDLLPGQGVWNTEFTSITIFDRTGLQNAGVILAGAFDFHDDRITGSVEVIDGGRTRTGLGVAYMGAVKCQPADPQFSYVQLWNPAGTGKNLVIGKIIVSVTTSTQVDFGPATVPLTSDFPSQPRSKLFAPGEVPTIAQTKYQNAPGYILGSSFGNVLVQANQSVVIEFLEPVVVTPGRGFTVASEAFNAALVTTYEYFEDKI